MTSGIRTAQGSELHQDTMTAVYNDLDSVKTLMEQAKDQVAAVIVEPVAANMGVVLPDEELPSGTSRSAIKITP